VIGRAHQLLPQTDGIDRTKANHSLFSAFEITVRADAPNSGFCPSTPKIAQRINIAKSAVCKGTCTKCIPFHHFIRVFRPHRVPIRANSDARAARVLRFSPRRARWRGLCRRHDTTTRTRPTRLGAFVGQRWAFWRACSPEHSSPGMVSVVWVTLVPTAVTSPVRRVT